MKKYYTELQSDPKAGGAQCIHMLLRNQGIHVDLKDVKEKCRQDNNGISIQGMLECLKAYQVEAKAYHASLEELKENATFPCILHFNDKGEGRYVVLFEIKDDAYIIGDPKRGQVTMYPDELEEVYTSVFISILHIGRTPEVKENTYWQFILAGFKNNRAKVNHFLFTAIKLTLFSILICFLFFILIDYFNEETLYSRMIIWSLVFLVLSYFKVEGLHWHQKDIDELHKELDEDYILDKILKLPDLPDCFYQMEKGLVHKELLSFYQLSEGTLRFYDYLLIDGVMLFFYTLSLVFIHPLFLVIMVSLLGLIFIYLKYTSERCDLLMAHYLEMDYLRASSFLDYIDNMGLIKRFQLQSKMNDMHNLYIDYALSREEKRQQEREMKHLVHLFKTLTFFVFTVAGLWLYLHHCLSIGKIVMLMMVADFIGPLLDKAIQALFDYHGIKYIYERYKNFNPEENSKVDIKEPIHSIVFDNVSYSYGYRENILEHIDLEIKDDLYIKGTSGSGKSTLLNLLRGFDMNYTGDIYFNDQELRTIDLGSLSRHIGYESSTPLFFQSSLYDNFLVDDEKKIMELLEAFGFIELAGLFTMTLNEDGSPLSKGQRQVVALIRLFLRDYDVYVLDEAFMGIDNRSAGKIYRYLVKKYSDKILIMVNHQTNLVNRHGDCVIIEKGRVKKKVE